MKVPPVNFAPRTLPATPAETVSGHANRSGKPDAALPKTTLPQDIGKAIDVKV